MRNLLKQGLKRLVERDEKRPTGPRDAKVIAVAAQKGGVGKTTTTVNVAASLARHHDLKVLVIDLDPQGHVEFSLREQVHVEARSLSSVLQQEENASVLDSVVHTDVPRLDITRADAALADTENLLNTRIGKEFVLRDALVVARTWYDVIVMDCPPNLGNLTVNALVAADVVLVPCDPTPLALEGVSELIQTSARLTQRLNPELDIAGIVVTRYDGRNAKMNEHALGRLRETWGEAVLETTIGINTALSRAQAAGQDIFTFDGGSRGATDYRALAAELASRLVLAPAT